MVKVKLQGSYVFDVIKFYVSTDLSIVECYYPFIRDEKYEEAIENYCTEVANVITKKIEDYGGVSAYLTDFFYKRTNAADNEIYIQELVLGEYYKKFLSTGKVNLIPPVNGMVPYFDCSNDYLSFVLPFCSDNSTGLLERESKIQTSFIYHQYAKNGSIDDSIFRGIPIRLLKDGIEIKWDKYLNMPESYFKTLYGVGVYNIKGSVESCERAIEGLKRREIEEIERKFNELIS